ncbi:MAG: hypothetical protein C0483_25800 [Pirellula sp.]|nr:hypothetical protein [Pirellula sp.]
MTPISEHPPAGATFPGPVCAGRENVRPASAAATIPAVPRLPCAADARSCLPLDFDQLLRRCMGRVELAERLLASFQERLPIEVAQIHECLAASDAVRLTRLVHQFKGTTANVSAPELHGIAVRMEQAAQAGQTETVACCLTEVAQAWQRFQQFRPSQPAAAGAVAPCRT